MKNALILECWYGNPTDHWYPWLKEQLESQGFQVTIPDLPTIRTDLPDLSQMLSSVDKEMKIDEKTTIIGHSIGALLAMRIAEKHIYDKMILVAGWDFNDLTLEHKLFWQTQQEV